MRAPILRILAALIALCSFAAPLAAHESYHDPALDGLGYCATCHPGFVGGSKSPLHALHTKGSDGMTNNCSLCHAENGRDNPLLMWSKDDGLGCMGCHGRDYGETVWSDYRDQPSGGKPKASGYGLRRVHESAGIPYCGACHAPFPDMGPVFGESVSPPYYSRDDVSLGDSPLDPCSNEDSPYDADGFGLDNDGDGLRDGIDPDCQPPEPDIALTPGTLFWDVVTIGASEGMLTQLENRGPADLVISQITSCTGTSAEFSWWPSTPIVVPPFGSEPLTVSYAPVDPGQDQGCLSIVSNDPDEPVVELQLTGTGFAPPWPDIQLVPASLDFGGVPVGGAGTLTTEVENLGQEDLVVTAIDWCTGTSGEFDWAPFAPFTVPPLSSRTLSVTFAPLDEGVELGCLWLLSNDPTEPLVELGLSGTGAPAGAGVDLDIERFRVDTNVKLSKGDAVTLELSVVTAGDEPGARLATIVGVQNAVQVYEQALMVSDPPGGGDSTWDFPPYAPVATGDIVWTASVADDDPDDDSAEELTQVSP